MDYPGGGQRRKGEVLRTDNEMRSVTLEVVCLGAESQGENLFLKGGGGKASRNQAMEDP